MSLLGGRSAIFPDKDRNWGPSYSPTPMYATFTYVYQVPNLSEKLGFKPLRWVTDNWELSGVTQLRGNIKAGYPTFSFANTNSTNLVLPNTTGTSGEGARVIVVGNVNLPSDQVSFVGGPTNTNIGVNGTPGNALINNAAFVMPEPMQPDAAGQPPSGHRREPVVLRQRRNRQSDNDPGYPRERLGYDVPEALPVKGRKAVL